jgi:tRNA dimethylallyltransferase
MTKVFHILGCTACGKASVGGELAKRLGGSILSVDSMKIYRRMNIGTATPSAEAQAEVPFYGIDLVEPSESFSVARYVECAEQAIRDIRSAGSIPLAVGGTALYIQSLVWGLFDAPSSDPAVRDAIVAEASDRGWLSMHDELREIDPQAADRIHVNDDRRIVRALEVYRTTGQPISHHQQQWNADEPNPRAVLIGLRREKEDQSHRINSRVRGMVDAGLVAEVEQLLAEPEPLSKQAAQAVGYAELISHFENPSACSLEKAVEQIKINTRRLAKKQRTWFRRWSRVQWFDLQPDDSVAGVTDRIMEAIDFD